MGDYKTTLSACLYMETEILKNIANVWGCHSNFVKKLVVVIRADSLLQMVEHQHGKTEVQRLHLGQERIFFYPGLQQKHFDCVEMCKSDLSTVVKKQHTLNLLKK